MASLDADNSGLSEEMPGLEDTVKLQSAIGKSSSDILLRSNISLIVIHNDVSNLFNRMRSLW